MNNRNSGRRRGRGGRTNVNRGPNDGNRIDARARGNASQLLEKYKGLARDAHQQGDRVMNEYYLQFADHYFRILAEANQRKEDQQREREESRKARRDDDGEDFGNEAEEEEAEEQAPKRKPRRARREEAQSDDRDEAGNDGEADGERIEADRLPAAIAVGGDDDEAEEPVNGKAARKPATRSRRKPAEGDEGLAAEA